MHRILCLLLQAAVAHQSAKPATPNAATAGESKPNSETAPRPSSPIPGRWTGKTGTAVSLALLPRMQGATAYTVRPVGPAGRRMEGFTVTGGNIVGTAPAPGKYVLMVFGTIRGQQQFQMAFFDVTP